MKPFLKNLPYFIYSLVILVIFSIILSAPYFKQLNNLFLDGLQGQIKPSPEIIIVGIDDKSLKEIGAWPWNREIFAKALENLSTEKPGVVGIDILFLEPREGDESLQQALNKVSFKTVLASKLVDGTEQKSIFSGQNILNGFVNFSADPDGKIRQTTRTVNINNLSRDSFSNIIFWDYVDFVFHKERPVLPETLQFSYTNKPFSSLSFINLYQKKYPESFFKNKIVLIGVTTTDLKNDLTDNFTDVFGRKIPGVEIHANIINSLLQHKLQQDLPLIIFYPSLFLINFFLILIYRKFKNNLIQFLIFLISLLIVNLVGILLYEFGTNFPFLQANILLIVTFIYVIAYKYFVEQKENKFVQKAFASYLNPKLLKALIENPGQLKLGGEKKEITVLFSDIRGFTTLSEKLSPEQLISFINSYLEQMCQIILKNNGTIDKFIGDAIMALWNAPLDDKNHQINAIKSALEMSEKLEEFNKSLPDFADIAIGIGINTGDMVVGNVGSSSRFDYTVLGDNVNLASRIEGLTKKYKVNILVAESVIKNLTDPEIIFRLIDEVIVKGKETPVKMYQPLFANEQNLQLKKNYEEGFKAYQKKDFKKALTYFKSLKKDGPSEIMIERIKELKNHKDFNSIWHWDEK